MAIDIAVPPITGIDPSVHAERVGGPDRQLLSHLFARVYGALSDQGVEALAFMPLSGSRPTCCVFASPAVSSRATLRWAGEMRTRAQTEFRAKYDAAEFTMLDNLSADQGLRFAAEPLETRDRLLMMEDRPMALLRVAGAASDGQRRPGVWEVVARQQPRFEAAEHVLTGANTLHEPLTGTYSRAFLDDALHRETARAHRHAMQLSLAVVRVQPRRVAEGGVIAASWLRTVAAATRDCVRETDIIGCISSTTLGVLMPNTGTRNALVAAGRIKQRVTDSGELPSEVECHIGISGWDMTGPHMPEIIEQATSAMDEARRCGGDRPFLYLA